MTVVWPVIAAVVGLALGITVGLLVQQMLRNRRIGAAEKDAEQIVTQAVMKQKEILLEAKDEALRLKQEREVEYRDRRAEMQRQEKRITQKEENLDHKAENLERKERNITQKERETENARNQVEELRKRQVQQLEMVSKMSTDEARSLLLQTVESQVRDEMNRRLHELEAQFKADAEQKSREILSMAIQRCAADVVSETTVSVVPLPSDEMKGRLIGREGRNIRALESATGVDLIIDDTPEAVTISSFDPVRREVARVALTKLISDGRIHPARIEEVVNKSKTEVDATIKEEGEQAAYKAGVAALHPELIKLLGRLKYRFSYGQNVLAHSLEVSYLAGVIASELGADVDKAKVAGLLHDIGKAVNHEVEGPHAAIGADIIKRLSRSPEVVQAVAEHHGESGTNSILGYIVSTADAISGSRPGARRESLEHYIKRLEALEGVANSFKGVDKSFAIQAGREVRIMVKPEEVDDMAAFQLARDIVKKIEESLEYPGQIKVTVVRETRAVDYAK